MSKNGKSQDKKGKLPGGGKQKNKNNNQQEAQAQPKKVASAADDMCILRYGGKGFTTNYAKFKLDVQVKAGQLFGNLSRFIILDEYYQPERPVMPRPKEAVAASVLETSTATKTSEPKLEVAVDDELNDIYKEEVKAYVQEIRKMKEDRPKMFWLIYGNLSNESLDKVKEHLADVWEEVLIQQDPLQLWRAITATHSAVSVGVAAVDSRKARMAYYALKQYAQESTVAYKERFDEVLKAWRSIDYNTPAMDAVAADFLASLDDARFGALKAELQNNSLLGVREYPETLLEAYQIANNFAGLRAQEKPSPVLATYATSVEDPKAKSKKGAKADADGDKKPAAEPGTVFKGKCFICKKQGHKANNCSQRAIVDAAINDSEDVQRAHTTLIPFSRSTYVTCFVGVTSEGKALPKDYILLDNQAQDHIFCNPNLLSNMQRKPTATKYMPGGWIAKTRGLFLNRIPVDLSTSADTNILSWNRLKESEGFTPGYNDKDDVFWLSSDDGQVCLYFRSYNGLYVCDYSSELDIVYSETNIFATVKEMEKQFTRREVASAQDARLLQKRLGYPGISKVIETINAGAILNLKPTARDVVNSVQIYGKSVPFLKGKSTYEPGPNVKPHNIPRMVSVVIELHIDMMFINHFGWVVSVGVPIGLTCVTPTGQGVGQKNAKTVGTAVCQHMAVYSKWGFRVSKVHSDDAGEIGAAMGKSFPGVQFQPVAAGKHDPYVERKIRDLKGSVRALLASLPFAASVIMLMWAVSYAVYCSNLLANKTGYMALAPREALEGRKIDFKRDLRVAFGDYCQVQERVLNNSMDERTVGAVAVLPTGNDSGSVKFISLRTGRVITRSTFTIIPWDKSNIELMNLWASKSEKVGNELAFQFSGQAVTEGEDSPGLADVIAAYEAGSRRIVGEYSPAFVESVSQPPVEFSNVVSMKTEEPVVTEDKPLYVDDHNLDTSESNVPNFDNDDQNAEAVIDQGVEASTDIFQKHSEVIESTIPSVESVEPAEQRYQFRERKGQGVQQGGWDHQGGEFITTDLRKRTYNMTVVEAIDKRGRDPTLEAAKAELTQLHIGAGPKGGPAWIGVPPSIALKLPRKLILPSKMFMKDKISPDGQFERLKARLVGGGHRQDKFEYEDISSPTASITSVMTIAAIAAKEHRSVMTVDVAGAYLHAQRGPNDKKIYMRLDSIMSKLMCAVDPSFRQFILPDETSVVEVTRALYGLLESAKQWYEEVSSYLVSIGFVKNPIDPCVFNMMFGNHQCTVVLFVDDCMVTCADPKALECVYDKLVDKYGKVAKHEGTELPFLGMIFDYNEADVVKISMPGFIDEILDECGVTGRADTPAGNNLFEVRDVSKLEPRRRELFHRRVAKLLYLAKRVRPDILLPVVYLCTRVLIADEDDWKKLSRVLNYLNASRNLGLRLGVGEDYVFTAYIDAAYGVHTDSKSHTGLALTLGKGVIMAQSSKQKIVTKSSTEAELVGASDKAGELIQANEFLRHQGYGEKSGKLLQDNISTMSLLKKGRSASDRTKHVKIRYFWVKDRVENGEIIIEHCPTGEMWADLLTKPLQGDLFVKFRKAILNIKDVP